MNKKDILNDAILGSYAEFIKNHTIEESSIEDWIIQSLVHLYLNNDAKGFLMEYQEDLNLLKFDILDLLADKYVQNINNLSENDIQDFFKKTIKETIKNDGIKASKDSLIKYIETADATAFGNIDLDDSKISQYSSIGLINVMCREYVNDVLQNRKKQLQKGKKSSTIQKNEFYPYEFFMVGGNSEQFDIDSVVSAMESIRNGKI